MALLLSSHQPTKHKFSPTTPPRPQYSESPETSKAFYRLATTPSPHVKNARHRSETPSPNESRSQPDEDEDEHGASEYRDVPSGLGLGLGIPVPGFTSNSNRNSYNSSTKGDPVNWRFSKITQPSSTSEPSSPSPSESVAGEERQDDQYSIYTLTPGPTWPPPPSSTVSPANTPRIPDEVEDEEIISRANRRNTPLSPLSPAISQLLDELSTLPRPVSITEPLKQPVTTVQAWVYDVPPVGVGRGRGRGHVNVRRMRSWRNLRAEGIRIDNAPSVPSLPSPPVTPTDEETTPRQLPQQNIDTLPRGGLPSPPHFHQERSLDSPPPEIMEPELDDRVEDADETLTANADEEGDDDDADAESIKEILRETPSEATIRPIASSEYLYSMESTPNPNSDLVHEIEELLESSPIRQHERKKSEEQAKIKAPVFGRLLSQESTGGASTGDEEFYTPREQATPFFEKRDPMGGSTASLNRGVLAAKSSSSLRREVTAARSTSSLRREVPAPLPELPAQIVGSPQVDPPETPTRPPIPRKSASRSAIPQVQEIAPLAGSVGPVAPLPHAPAEASSNKAPLRPIIPQRRSSLTHSRNTSIDAALASTSSSHYPPVSLRPDMHTRGKSVDSSSLYDRERERPTERLAAGNVPHRRSISADADNRYVNNNEDARGRKPRSRSIDEGPPDIPSRRSSLGKAGRVADVFDRGVRPTPTRNGSHTSSSECSAIVQAGPSIKITQSDPLNVDEGSPVASLPEQGRQRPPLHQRSRTDSSDYMQACDSNVSVRDSVQIISGEERAEVVHSGVVKSGSIKRVLVRSPSQKQAEFALTTPKIEPPLEIPSFNFGDGPELTLNSETEDPNKNSVADLPVVFQVIPPTPFAFGPGEDASMQLSLQVPQLVQIPATPDPTNVGEDYLMVKPMHISTPAPNTEITGDNILSPIDKFNFFPVDSPPSTEGGLLPPTDDKKSTPPPGLFKRPLTAPERITEFPTAPPPRHRPKLKSRPTTMRQSKLHPWWRPKVGDEETPESSNVGTDWGSERPGTGTSLTTVSSAGGVGRRGKKKHSLRLGGMEIEFVGVKGLLEERRRRKAIVKGKGVA